MYQNRSLTRLLVFEAMENRLVSTAQVAAVDPEFVTESQSFQLLKRNRIVEVRRYVLLCINNCFFP